MITVLLSVAGIAALVAIAYFLAVADENRGKNWKKRIDQIRNTRLPDRRFHAHRKTGTGFSH